MSNSVNAELIGQIEAAHAALKNIYTHYDRAEKLRKEAEEAEAALHAQKKLFQKIGIPLVIISGIIPPLGWLIVIALGLLVLHQVKKKQVAEQVQQCKASAVSETGVAEQLIVDNLGVLSILPDDYWYPMASENILKILREGRVTTLNDALDRFDRLRREWQMDQRYAELSAAMVQQSNNLESIERSSRINAAINAGRAAADITGAVGRGVGKFFNNIG